MTNLATIQTSGAIYTPAISKSYATFVMKDESLVRNGNLPAGISVSDLNFLDPQSKLFHISHALYSAGQAMSGRSPCMVTNRDRENTTIIGDSGGYQIISGGLQWEGDVTRRKVLNWLEVHCDVAMTLDIPTASVTHPDSEFATFDECLDTTVENLCYFRENRRGSTRFLNVLQGQTRHEAKRWYRAVREFEFDGWAFGGDTKLDLISVLRRLICMRDEHRLEEENWIHFLGTSQLSVACVLTTLQEQLRKNVGSNITVSYDTSSPFIMAGKKNGYTFPTLTKAGFSMGASRMPVERANVGSLKPFPFSSAVGEKLTLGDLCVNNGDFQDSPWDDVSWRLIANHNLDLLLRSISKAQRVYNLEVRDALECCPLKLVRARESIKEVFQSETPFDVIIDNTADLQIFSKLKDEIGEDHWRELDR